jgi:CheY-like chemotaxis protein
VTASRAVVEARGHELSVTVSAGAFRMLADATRIEQVVVNLLTNAAKYTEPGGSISVRVTREVDRDAKAAVLSLKDSGRGIPAEMLAHVFDSFVQVMPTLDRTTGGLGLGLTLVKGLVELHGGSVSARSDGPNTGSEFVVRLPLSSDAHVPGEKVKPSPRLERPKQSRRIVLVEDSEDLRDMFQEFLEGLGHEVNVARTGLEGLEKVLRLRPDVALVDIGLPGIDGYELARQVRASPGGDRVVLVALTGYGGDGARARAEGAGFDLHLTKPVDVDALPDVLALARGAD